ncbi:MAG: lipoate protein ligase C-terminal domain-containing protein [Candidatus Thorarchaeota archaeon]
MQEANYKVPGGKLVKVKLNVSSGKIERVQILGDFFLHPEETIIAIEESLSGCQKDTKLIEKIIVEKLEDSEATLIGATAEDFAKTIIMAWESN